MDIYSLRINNAPKCATVSVGLPYCVEACSLELWPLAQLCAVATPYVRNNSDFPLVILNQSCLICSNVGGGGSCWGPAPLSMFTSLIMKLEPCGAHTPGLHWSPNSIAPLINAQMMMADPLPFLSHILYSAAPSVSALPVHFFCTQLVYALILTPLCPSVQSICQQHLTSTRQLIFVFKRRSDIRTHVLQAVITALMNPLKK